jgi:tetratricopeptide (TPR) repeat protein
VPKHGSKHKREETKDRAIPGISWDPIIKVLSGVAAFAVSMGGVYSLVKDFREDTSTFLWIIIPALVFLVLTIVLIQLFRSKNPFFYIFLAIIIVGGVAGGQAYKTLYQAKMEKLIVLFARFDGPENTYGIRNKIIEKLATDFTDKSLVQILPISEAITPEQGTDYARELGEKYTADIVIWGWYRPTANPNITIHIENLSVDQINTLAESTTCEPITTIADLNSFSFQSQLSMETSSFINFLAGLISYKSNDFQEAISYFDKAILNYQSNTSGIPNDLATIYYDRANSKSFSKQKKLALADYDEALSLNPGNYCSYINRGMSRGELGKYELALDDINKALSIDPENVKGYLDRAWIYLQMEQYDKAMDEINAVIKNNPQDSGPYALRGSIYTSMRQYYPAMNEYAKSFELDPDGVYIYLSRAATYNEWSKYDEAIKDLNKAADLDPKNGDVFFNRALTYSKMRQFDKAIADFSKAIEIYPRWADCYNHRGYVYALQKQYDLAMADFKTSLELDPENAEVYLLRGETFKDMGKGSESEADFAKYKELTGEEVP